MTIRIQCRCGKRYRVPESRAGQSADCRRCGRELDVPEPVAVSAFELDASQLPGFDEPDLQPAAVIGVSSTSRNRATTYALKHPAVSVKPMFAENDVDFANLDVNELEGGKTITTEVDDNAEKKGQDNLPLPSRTVTIPMPVEVRKGGYMMLAWLGGWVLCTAVLWPFTATSTAVVVGLSIGLGLGIMVASDVSHSLKLKRTKSGKLLFQIHQRIGHVPFKSSTKVSRKDELIMHVSQNRFQRIDDIRMLALVMFLLPFGFLPGIGVFYFWYKNRGQQSARARVKLYLKEHKSSKRRLIISVFDTHYYGTRQHGSCPEMRKLLRAFADLADMQPTIIKKRRGVIASLLTK